MTGDDHSSSDDLYDHLCELITLQLAIFDVPPERVDEQTAARLYILCEHVATQRHVDSEASPGYVAVTFLVDLVVAALQWGASEKGADAAKVWSNFVEHAEVDERGHYVFPGRT